MELGNNIRATRLAQRDAPVWRPRAVCLAFLLVMAAIWFVGAWDVVGWVLG